MNITYRNGLPPSYLRVLTAMARIMQTGLPITHRGIAIELGWASTTAWVGYCLRHMKEIGLVSMASGAGTVRPTCRFYTYEELNPKEEPNGTAGNTEAAADGEVRAAAQEG